MLNKKIIVSAVVLVFIIVAFIFAYKGGYFAKLPYVGKYLSNNTDTSQVKLPDFDKNIKNVKVHTLRQGSGRAIQKGDIAYVFYAAVLPDGKVFDTNQGSQPMGFLVGEGALIKGLEQALIGIKEGTEIIVDVPAHLAYGEKGVKIKDKVIVPPNTPLRFDILVIKVMSKEELKKLQEQMAQKAQNASNKEQSKDKEQNKNKGDDSANTNANKDK